MIMIIIVLFYYGGLVHKSYYLIKFYSDMKFSSLNDNYRQMPIYILISYVMVKYTM